MPTLADGIDFVVGDIVSYQQLNRMKDNFRAAAAPSNPVGGMLHSDSDDDRLNHRATAAWNEILQANVIFGDDIEIGDDFAIIFGDDGDSCLGYLNAGDIWHLCDGAVLGNNIRMSINATGLSVFGVAPVAQQGPIAAATGAGDIVPRFNEMRTAMINLGFIT